MGNFLDFVNKKTTTQEQNKVDVNQLNAHELEYLLHLMKNSTLRGEQVELFYTLVVKLQNQYLAVTSTK